MDAIGGSRELRSGYGEGTFHSATRPLRFGEARTRVDSVPEQARRGELTRDYDTQKAYLMSVVSGWAYADGQTLADKIQHYGFDQGGHVQQFSVVNDAMLVVARAYLIRSEEGRVGILAFRGTEPVNAMNWLTNADTTAREFHGGGQVHHGFHANVEAVWSYIESAIGDAVQGRPPRPGNGSTGHASALEPLQHLYITGHSLGGAMAVLAAAKLFCDDSYMPWRPLVRGVYTFGQPLVGDADFARACSGFERMLYRHEYRHDVIPALPPGTVADSFRHFGVNRVSPAQERPWAATDRPTRALKFLVQGLACVSASFFTRRLLLLRRLDGLWYSIDDHLPQRYINTCKASLPTARDVRVRSAGTVEPVGRAASPG